MGHIEDRWWWRPLPDGTKVGRDRVGVGLRLRLRARYRDADGRHRAESFAQKKDAERFLVLVRADLLRGSYVDPGPSGATCAPTPSCGQRRSRYRTRPAAAMTVSYGTGSCLS